MPYGGTTPEQDKKIERCVLGLEGKTNPKTKKPYTESERIAICKSSVMGKGPKNVEIEKISLSTERLIKIEMVENTDTYTLLKFELIDDNAYNGLHFTAEAIRAQYKNFKTKTYPVSHGLDHTRATLDQLGEVIDMELIELDGGHVKCNIISKIYKETTAQKEAQVLFKQGLLNYISGGWNGKIVFNEEKGRFELIDSTLREVSSTPTPAKKDAKLLEIMNSLGKSPELEELEMAEEPKDVTPEQKGESEQTKKLTALEAEINALKASQKAIGDAQIAAERTALLKRGAELGLTEEDFKGKSNSEIAVGLEMANKAQLVALRDKVPPTHDFGAASGLAEGSPEAAYAFLKEHNPHFLEGIPDPKGGK